MTVVALPVWTYARQMIALSTINATLLMFLGRFLRLQGFALYCKYTV
jgi:hypothetical protein